MSEDVRVSHPDIVKRLKRAGGHLNSVIAMIESDKPCLGSIQQLHAVEKAITQTKKALIHDHLDHCEDAVGTLDADSRATINQFCGITRYL